MKAKAKAHGKSEAKRSEAKDKTQGKTKPRRTKLCSLWPLWSPRPHTNELKCKHLVMDGRHVLAWLPLSHSRAQLLRRAVRQADRQWCGQGKERGKKGRGRGRETNKQRPQACTIRRSQARQAGRQSAVVVVEIGCETVSHGITITTHTNARVHVHTNTHSKIEAQPQLKSFYCPQHKRAQRESESGSGRAKRHTHIHAQRIRKQKPRAVQQAQARRAHSI